MTAQNRCSPRDGGPVDDQVVARCPHCWSSAAVMLGLPLRFLLGDQTAEVTVRAVVAGGAGDRQIRGDPAFRFLGAFGDQLCDSVVIVFTFDAGSRSLTCLFGLESFDGASDGLVGGAAQLGGCSVRPDLVVGGNDVHTVPRRLQWNSPGGAVCGWHLHRSGHKFLIDTTNTGWGLLSARLRKPRRATSLLPQHPYSRRY